MGLINFILNIAGLLLWLGWRDARVDTLVPTSAASLIRTLRRVGPSEWMRWKYFFGLAGLLVGRAMIYAWIGPAVRWIPALWLGPVALPLRSELFSRMLLFSLLSFGMLLAGFYLALLLFSLVNRQVTDDEPLQKFIRRHLGRVERWPWMAKLALPFGGAIIGWLLLSPLLTRWEIVPAAALGLRLRQGCLIGLGLCLIWKQVIAGTLLLYFLNSHVYFGNVPLWGFVTVTARNLLAPVRWWPMRVGRLDLAPLVVIALVYLLAGGIHHHSAEPGAVGRIMVPGLIDLFRWWT